VISAPKQRDSVGAARLGRVVTTGRALAEAVAAVLPMRWIPTSFPVQASDVDTEFLNGVFARNARTARVVHAQRVGGTSGTTDRVRLALTWDRAGEPDVPGRVFIKSTPLTAKNRTMVAALSMARNEVFFYRHARSALGADVAPRCFAARAAAGARHLLVLEDITERGGIPKALADDIDAAYARSMMITLGELHAAFWESPRLHTDLKFVRPERSRPGFFVAAASVPPRAVEPAAVQ
jgi:hypothetical protein